MLTRFEEKSQKIIPVVYFTAVLIVCITHMNTINLAWPLEHIVRLISAVAFATTLILALAIHRTYPPKHSRAKHFPKLMTEGPYKYCRHPFYTLMISWAIAATLYVLSLQGLITAIALSPLWYIRAKIEEKDLERHWGRQYIEYKRRAPMFIPVRFRREYSVKARTQV